MTTIRSTSGEERCKTASEDARRLAADAICLALLLASSPASHAVIPSFADGPWFAWYVVPLMVTLVAACLVCLARYHAVEGPGRQTALLGAAAYACGAVAFALGGPFLQPVFLIGAGVLTGMGGSVVAIRAVALLGRSDMCENLTLVGGALLASSLVCCAYMLVGGTGAQALFCACLAIGLVWLLRTDPVACARTCGDDRAEPRSTGVLDLFSSVMSIPLLGVFSYAMFLKPGVVADAARPLLWGLDEETLLYMAAAAALLCVGLARPRRPLYTTVYRVVVPVCIIAVLVFQSFPHGTVAYGCASVCSVFVNALMVQFALVVTFTTAAAPDRHPMRSACPLLVAYALGRLGALGMTAFAAAWTDDAYVVYQVVMTFLMACMLVLVLLQYRKGMKGDVRPLQATMSEVVGAACGRLAAEGGLSEREQDVLAMMARGYAPAYIADALVISDSTVRTHVKAIYRKLGISSREELIGLVEKASVGVAGSAA